MGENGLSLLDLESLFYAVLSKLPKWPSVKSTLIEVPGTETAKGRGVFDKAEIDRIPK
jgi:hypothetical protein